MQGVAKLKGESRQKYILALIRDYGTLEITDLDNRTSTQVIKAAIFDFLAGSAGSAALGAASVKGLKEYATGGMTSGLADLLSQAIKDPLSTSKIRLALLEQYIKERCGCLFPMEGQFRSGPAWREPVIPNVRGKYQTHLGQLVACGGKLQSGALDHRQEYAQTELDKLMKLRKQDPSRFLAYLVNFSYDIETMQQELLEDQHAFSDMNFLIGLGLGAIAAATGPALLAAGPAAASTATAFYEKAFEAVVGSIPGAVLSAGYTGTVEMSSYPYEKQLLVGIAGLRRTVLQSISLLPGDCGCGEKKVRPAKKKASRPPSFQEVQKEGYWLVVSGERLDLDFGDEAHITQWYGREAVLEGPMFMSRGEAAAAVCARISDRRIDRNWPRNGYYGDYKGKTYFIGSLGNCGDKISDERRP